MPRKLRIEIAGFYHIINRGVVSCRCHLTPNPNRGVVSCRCHLTPNPVEHLKSREFKLG